MPRREWQREGKRDNRKVRGTELEIALCMRRQVHSVITRINRINLVAHAGMTFISDTCLQQKQLYATRYLPRDWIESRATGERLPVVVVVVRSNDFCVCSFPIFTPNGIYGNIEGCVVLIQEGGEINENWRFRIADLASFVLKNRNCKFWWFSLDDSFHVRSKFSFFETDKRDTYVKGIMVMSAKFENDSRWWLMGCKDIRV